MADLYSFMDFESANVMGGAGALVSTVKAFAGAGIANKVVALFDNDTAALSALRSLNRINLPENVRVLRYPRLHLAQSYPTLGPTGQIEMDVNGLAGSIELYYGEDVLRRENGSLAPVQWRGFDVAVGQYQGEVLEKSQLGESFARKLTAAESNTAELSRRDWSGMRVILEGLFRVFE